ncbi:YT521-B-like domain-containing protein [Mycena galopus ATCC 62051]|nr:YT521-B-like domain-containing protein [Mycena galopus ATCC 62051]
MPLASPITPTSVGAPVWSAGSSRGKGNKGDSNKNRDKAKDVDRAQPLVRQPYHSTPPVSRSDWVMWVGNVPSNARHDELWRFFTEGASSIAHGHGILSIFLIARSACAFVNYSSAAALSAAIAQFDGVPLRAGKAGRALECRARDGDDDLRAGVGGQRGVGMHKCWMRDRRRESLEAESGAHSESARNMNEDKDAATSSSASPGGSTSTTSSMLALHFPQRFFILKSLTREDLDLSVRTGVWATQHHNEGVLDRAFRTAADVVLIFSVNKSGEFYGWARCGEGWGQNFALHWMCTASLPFTRTQSLRNPWNHGRQVKIARDGTEIEPAVGHALIEQWSGSRADEMLQGLKLAE